MVLKTVNLKNKLHKQDMVVVGLLRAPIQQSDIKKLLQLKLARWAVCVPITRHSLANTVRVHAHLTLYMNQTVMRTVKCRQSFPMGLPIFLLWNIVPVQTRPGTFLHGITPDQVAVVLHKNFFKGM